MASDDSLHISLPLSTPPPLSLPPPSSLSLSLPLSPHLHVHHSSDPIVLEHISNIFCIQLVSRYLYSAQHLILLNSTCTYYTPIHMYIAQSIVDLRFCRTIGMILYYVPGTVCGKPSIELHRSCFRVVTITETTSVHVSMVILESI